MARPSKVEVSAINIRINSDKERNYALLLKNILDQKIAMKVHGDTYLAVTAFDPKSGFGVFSRYTEIELEGDWFDIEKFGPADESEINKVSIPDKLRPNLSSFRFKLFEENHIIVFEVYSESKALSAKYVEKYFIQILGRHNLRKTFGAVQVDLIKNYEEVERILALKNLREIRILVKRPNQDDISGDLASIIEERLAEQNAESLEEIVRTKEKDGLALNKRTKKLAFIGAENGEISAKNYENGMIIPHSTEEKIEKISDTYFSEKTSAFQMFRKVATRFRDSVVSRRRGI